MTGALTETPPPWATDRAPNPTLDGEADWLEAAARDSRERGGRGTTEEFRRGFECAARWVRFHAAAHLGGAERRFRAWAPPDAASHFLTEAGPACGAGGGEQEALVAAGLQPPVGCAPCLDLLRAAWERS